MIFQQYQTKHLNIEYWSIGSDQCWAVVIRNGSVKKYLAQALLDQQHNPENKELTFSLVSFEQQQQFYENELKNDDSDFIGGPDPGSTVRTLLDGAGDDLKALGFLNLENILDRGYRLLSSGESRKILLAQAILQKPDYLILDEPYDSLDKQSQKELSAFFSNLVQQGNIQLIFLLNDLDEIKDWHSHVAILEKGELIAEGQRQEILNNQDLHVLFDFDAATLPIWPEALNDFQATNPIIALNKAKISYSGVVIFKNINLHIKPGEHTLLTGPNGSGKSTLLHLITGDHPQSYGNDISVLGFKRGSGESIWELKKQIGIVSPELHRNHRVSGSALQIILSGFFDSIGLYETSTPLQITHAKHWLALVGLERKSSLSFKSLTYGEQRLVLIARALVKQPALLICDEPTQGLDQINRHRFLHFLEHLSSQQRTTVVMASHRNDEHLSLFKHHVKL